MPQFALPNCRSILLPACGPASVQVARFISSKSCVAQPFSECLAERGGRAEPCFHPRKRPCLPWSLHNVHWALSIQHQSIAGSALAALSPPPTNHAVSRVPVPSLHTQLLATPATIDCYNGPARTAPLDSCCLHCASYCCCLHCAFCSLRMGASIFSSSPDSCMLSRMSAPPTNSPFTNTWRRKVQHHEGGRGG